MPILKPSLHILTVWRIRLLLCALLPSFLSAYFFPRRGLIWWICTAAWVVVFCFFYIFYLPIRRKKLAYGGNARCLIIHCGVIYTRARAIPYENIQYVSQATCPLERLFGICTLALYMAGATARLPGLTLAQAETIRTVLQQKQQGDKP